ncbi:MAG: aminomethyl-transferring glycine dehydrogenase subunit GcvPA [Planctomycetota bacterium]
MSDISYLPHGDADRRAMMDTIGVRSLDELFGMIPAEARVKGALSVIPPSLTEMELVACVGKLAAKNADGARFPSFLGAGIYDHFIPAVVDFLSARSEFYTAYTPYQPEASQGTLQAIFEYQSMITALTGLDVSNASLYDGASAAAEAAAMARATTRRDRVIVSRAVHPDTRRVLATYLTASGGTLVECPLSGGRTDLKALAGLLGKDVAAIILQQPNFFGCLEEMEDAGKLAKGGGSTFVASVDPVSLGFLEPPGAWGADIAMGEGQSLGNPPCAGGATFGFMAVREGYLRRLPGRVVGETTDRKGRRGFVLTLQAREQHIRREKAGSNICSNQGLMALRGAIYLAAVGPVGLRRVAGLSVEKAHALAARIGKINGYASAFPEPFFKEFAVTCPAEPARIQDALLEKGLLGGYDLGREYPEFKRHLLIAVTEKRTDEEMGRLASVLETLC